MNLYFFTPTEMSEATKCPKCGKVSFSKLMFGRNDVFARQRRIAMAQEIKFPEGTMRVRYYRCPFCGATTTVPLDEKPKLTINDKDIETEYNITTDGDYVLKSGDTVLTTLKFKHEEVKKEELTETK